VVLKPWWFFTPGLYGSFLLAFFWPELTTPALKLIASHASHFTHDEISQLSKLTALLRLGHEISNHLLGGTPINATSIMLNQSLINEYRMLICLMHLPFEVFSFCSAPNTRGRL
jgi:hypothetical protein